MLDLGSTFLNVWSLMWHSTIFCYNSASVSTAVLHIAIIMLEPHNTTEECTIIQVLRTSLGMPTNTMWQLWQLPQRCVQPSLIKQIIVCCPELHHCSHTYHCLALTVLIQYSWFILLSRSFPCLEVSHCTLVQRRGLLKRICHSFVQWQPNNTEKTGLQFSQRLRL